MVLGGVSLFCLWVRDLLHILPEDWKSTNTSDDSAKEEKPNENP